jgi:hypothetical protein
VLRRFAVVVRREHHEGALAFGTEALSTSTVHSESNAKTCPCCCSGNAASHSQRGSRRYEVFRDEADRLEYLELLCGCRRDARPCIIAYCLRPGKSGARNVLNHPGPFIPLFTTNDAAISQFGVIECGCGDSKSGNRTFQGQVRLTF